ncbi:MAG TPA: hypothetical protein VEH06_05110, partial [Candidatus Bathyarchaeia archaeon]|nr:hypothetical protein [Candidatus Bathyarchaeia archaeon]
LFTKYLLVLILFLSPVLAHATASSGHSDFTYTKGCPWPNFWYDNICHHQPPPRAVATTTIQCHNGTCKSSGWIPLRH